MAYSRTNTFSNGNTPTAAQIDANFTGIRTYVAEGIVAGDVTSDITIDKIRPPEQVYNSGKASMTLLTTGCVAGTSNPAVGFRREKVRDVSLTYNGFIHRAIHFAMDKPTMGHGREIPKTGVSFYLERDCGVRVAYNIMLNTYASPESLGGTPQHAPDDDNFIYIMMYKHDNGEHNEPVYPRPVAEGRAVFPNTNTDPGSVVVGDGPAGLRCISIHKCFNKTVSGGSKLTPGWYSVALFTGLTGHTKFALVGANTCVVEAYHGISPTISSGTSIP